MQILKELTTLETMNEALSSLQSKGVDSITIIEVMLSLCFEVNTTRTKEYFTELIGEYGEV